MLAWATVLHVATDWAAGPAVAKDRCFVVSAQAGIISSISAVVCSLHAGVPEHPLPRPLLRHGLRLRYLCLISRQLHVKALEPEPLTQGPRISERECSGRHVASQFPSLSRFVLLAVSGQCGERLAERDSSLCVPIRLYDVYI